MNLICGINPVLEALAAGTRHFDRLLVVKGLRSKRLSEAIRRATTLGDPAALRDARDARPHGGRRRAPGHHRDRLREAGAVARRACSTPPASRRSWWCSTASRTRATSARSCARRRRRAPTACMLPERHSAGLSETVARASAGALEHVKVARVGNLVQALEALKERGIWVVGFDAGRQRALGRGRPDAARRARARRRGARHPAAGARALRPPGLDPALRPRRLAQRVGGRGHRALRGRAAARRRAERRAADPGARRARRRSSARRPDDGETDPGARRDGARRDDGDGDEAEDVAAAPCGTSI